MTSFPHLFSGPLLEEKPRFFGVDRADGIATVVEWEAMPDGSIYIHDLIELPVARKARGRRP